MGCGSSGREKPLKVKQEHKSSKPSRARAITEPVQETSTAIAIPKPVQETSTVILISNL